MLLDYDTITICNSVLIINKDGEIQHKEISTLENEAIIEILYDLIENSYFIISANEKTVYFGRWKDLFSWDAGFAFSVDGTGELDIQFMVDQELMNRSHWYYYESDNNEWRNKTD